MNSFFFLKMSSDELKEPLEKTSDSGSENRSNEIKNYSDLPLDRQTLIDTAVRFLQNPKVVPTELESKRQFLQKKGLNDPEIQIALQKSGTLDYHTNSRIDETSVSRLVPPQLPAKRAEPVVSFWSKLLKWARALAVAGCIAFTAYKLFIKKYLGLDKKSKEKHTQDKLVRSNEQLTQSVQEMRASLALLKESVEAMSDAVKQISAQKLLGAGDDATGLKSEVQSIKSLLLNRSQFPSLPAVNPIIPTWQLDRSKTPPKSEATANNSSPPTINNGDDTVTSKEEYNK